MTDERERHPYRLPRFDEREETLHIKRADLQPLRYAALKVIAGPPFVMKNTPVGSYVEIASVEARIGRDPRRVNLQLYGIRDRSSVSGLHCAIRYDAESEQFLLRDEGSTAGTRVRNRGPFGRWRKVEPGERIPLHTGDVIELGDVNTFGAQLEFSLIDAPSEPAKPRLFPDNYADILKYIRASEAPTVINPTFREEISTLKEASPADRHSPDVQIFISYSRTDATMMRKIRDRLRRHRFGVWTDEENIVTGEDWQRRLEKAINEADCVLVVMSPDARESRPMQAEIDYAQEQNKPLFPVLVGGKRKEAMLFGLRGMHYIDIRDDFDQGMDRVVQDIRRRFYLD